MKRQIFMLSMALVLVMGAALMAQTTTTTTQPVPPSQQVDQSGEPETGSGMDVDVDAGANAENGVLDADVTATTDSDTSANDQTSALPDEPNQGNNLQNNRNPVATGTTATGQAVRDVTNTEDVDTDVDADMDQTGTYSGTTDTAMDDQSSLPQTASELPLLGLIGLLALAGAFAVRSIR